MATDTLKVAILLVGLTACSAVISESIQDNEIPSSNKSDFWEEIASRRQMLLGVEAAFKKLKERREMADSTQINQNTQSHLEEAIAETARKFASDPRVREVSATGTMRVESINAAAREFLGKPGPYEESVAEAARMFGPDSSQSENSRTEYKRVFEFVNGAARRFRNGSGQSEGLLPKTPKKYSFNPSLSKDHTAGSMRAVQYVVDPNTRISWNQAKQHVEQAGAEAAKKFLDSPDQLEESVAETARKFGLDSVQNKESQMNDGRVLEPVNEAARKFRQYLAEAMAEIEGKIALQPVRDSMSDETKVFKSVNAAIRRSQNGSSQLEGSMAEAAQKFGPDPNQSEGNMTAVQYVNPATRDYLNQYEQAGAKTARMFSPEASEQGGSSRNGRVFEPVSAWARQSHDAGLEGFQAAARDTDSTVEGTGKFAPQIITRQRRSSSDVENIPGTMFHPGTPYKPPPKPLTHDQLLASVRNDLLLAHWKNTKFQDEGPVQPSNEDGDVTRKRRSVIPDVAHPWLDSASFDMQPVTQENPSATNVAHQGAEAAEAHQGPSRQKRSPQPEPWWPLEYPKLPTLSKDEDASDRIQKASKAVKETKDEVAGWLKQFSWS